MRRRTPGWRRALPWLAIAGWLGAADDTAAQDHAGCLSEAMRSLTFLVGDWQVASRYRGMDGVWEATTARSTITAELDGCLLLERLTGVRDGAPFAAIASLTFDALEGRLRRTWVDSGHGLLVVYDGVLEDDALTLTAHLAVRGREVQFQHALSALSPDGFELHSRRSVDGGATWDTGWTLLYTRLMPAADGD